VAALVGDPRLAVLARPARRAAASVGALAGVSAGGAVLARAVVGTVVQVLVAEEAAPAFVAAALEGLGAGAVHAARVAHATVAVRALPAGLAPEEKNSGQLAGDFDARVFLSTRRYSLSRCATRVSRQKGNCSPATIEQKGRHRYTRLPLLARHVRKFWAGPPSLRRNRRRGMSPERPTRT